MKKADAIVIRDLLYKAHQQAIELLMKFQAGVTELDTTQPIRELDEIEGNLAAVMGVLDSL